MKIKKTISLISLTCALALKCWGVKYEVDLDKNYMDKLGKIFREESKDRPEGILLEFKGHFDSDVEEFARRLQVLCQELQHRSFGFIFSGVSFFKGRGIPPRLIEVLAQIENMRALVLSGLFTRRLDEDEGSIVNWLSEQRITPATLEALCGLISGRISSGLGLNVYLNNRNCLHPEDWEKIRDVVNVSKNRSSEEEVKLVFHTTPKDGELPAPLVDMCRMYPECFVQRDQTPVEYGPVGVPDLEDFWGQE